MEIALSLCRILSIKGNVVEIDEIDAHHDTPVLDLKPYLRIRNPPMSAFLRGSSPGEKAGVRNIRCAWYRC
ncbi:MAG TPA: TrmO family methyltransferase [Acidobacteriota bacterium]|nr:TrmO family methyltransferase [Acidobacteriota bacterium]